MTKIKIQTFFIVKTDTYTGNVDSYLTGLLFGQDDDRYGCESGIKEFEQNFDAETTEDFLIWAHPESEWNHAYAIYNLGTNKGHHDLSFYVNDGKEFRDHAKRLKELYEGKLVGDEDDGWFTISGFAIVTRTSEITETVTEL